MRRATRRFTTSSATVLVGRSTLMLLLLAPIVGCGQGEFERRLRMASDEALDKDIEASQTPEAQARLKEESKRKQQEFQAEQMRLQQQGQKPAGTP